jgi:hypothetical protein
MAEALEQEETRLVSNGEETCSGFCGAVADYGRERAFIDLLTEE